MNIGQIIKQYRVARNLSIDEFIKNSSLTKGYISMLENNLNPATGKPIKPSVEKMRVIAGIIGLSLTDLLKLLDDDTEITISEEPDKNDDPELLILARNINDLSEEQKSLIVSMIDQFRGNKNELDE